MSLLDWHPAGREDRDALRRFTCTEPEKRRRVWGQWQSSHRRPWELFVQARIHELSPPYPSSTGEYLLLGWDQHGIGAVVFYQELDGPGQVEMYLAAVATRYRRRGRGWADELMKTALDAVTVRAVETGCDLVEVSGWIHESNTGSQDLARRFGFRHTGTKEDEALHPGRAPPTTRP